MEKQNKLVMPCEENYSCRVEYRKAYNIARHNAIKAGIWVTRTKLEGMPLRTDYLTYSEYRAAYLHEQSLRRRTPETRIQNTLTGMPQRVDFVDEKEYSRTYSREYYARNAEKILARMKVLRGVKPLVESPEEEEERKRKIRDRATKKRRRNGVSVKERIIASPGEIVIFPRPEDFLAVEDYKKAYSHARRQAIKNGTWTGRFTLEGMPRREDFESAEAHRFEYVRVWRQKNPEKTKRYTRRYRDTHPEVGKPTEGRREYVNDRYANDLQYKLKVLLRTRLRKALRGNFKSGHVVDLLGCTIPEFKIYIEKQFIGENSWMTFENHGSKTWHLDHVRPCYEFDHTDPEQVRVCWHYTNMRPLAASINLSRSKGRSKTPNAKAA